MFRILFLITGLVMGFQLDAKETIRGFDEFESWGVTIRVDDFDNEVKPTLVSNIYDVDGTDIGGFFIHYFTSNDGEFGYALVSIMMRDMEDIWPDCDYEFMKYKIDSSKTEYYPSSGAACPTLEFNSSMAEKFKNGNEFRFSASGRTGIVKLSGFVEAWKYTLDNLKK